MPFSVFLLFAEDVHLHLPSQLASLHAPVRAHGQSVPAVHGAAETQWAWPGQGKILHSQGLLKSLPKSKCSCSRESSVGLNRLKTWHKQLDFDSLFTETCGKFPHCSACPPWGLLLLHFWFYQKNLWTRFLNRPKSALWKSKAEVLMTLLLTSLRIKNHFVVTMPKAAADHNISHQPFSVCTQVSLCKA